MSPLLGFISSWHRSLVLAIVRERDRPESTEGNKWPVQGWLWFGCVGYCKGLPLPLSYGHSRQDCLVRVGKEKETQHSDILLITSLYSSQPSICSMWQPQGKGR